MLNIGDCHGNTNQNQWAITPHLLTWLCDIKSWWESRPKGTPVYCCWGYTWAQPLCKTSCKFPEVLKTKCCGPVILLLSKGIAMLPCLLLQYSTIVYNQSICYITHTYIPYTYMSVSNKNNKILAFVVSWINLDDITLWNKPDREGQILMVWTNTVLIKNCTVLFTCGI